ncbi:hypothetical protein E2C01_071315 [Portunus trituberculatus]|uniref:Uncharacterized protein n=1 Tax=Portunus trituberculatus TaxID=210409 RepID=A0A5B7HWP0_PORTR|nr:hypothetical protein [Portunus trituberculatus]
MMGIGFPAAIVPLDAIYGRTYKGRLGGRRGSGKGQHLRSKVVKRCLLDYSGEVRVNALKRYTGGYSHTPTSWSWQKLTAGGNSKTHE